MKIAFRVDAGKHIGTGHVMRCLTLAEVLRKQGCQCKFISRNHPGNLNSLIRCREFELHELPPGNRKVIPDDYKSWLSVTWEEDAEETLESLGKEKYSWVIVDHYALGPDWESSVKARAKCKLMAIDDLARPHDYDLLLDQNLVADWKTRYNAQVGKNCALLGPNYALLQEHYSQLHDRIPSREGKIHRMFAYFGGADQWNLTGLAISAFLSLKDSNLILDVVCSHSSPHTESIQQLVAEHRNIHLHTSLQSLAPLMAQADLAIGASGATSWERCCMGLPSMVITLAENQKPIALELQRIGLIHNLGHAGEVEERDLTEALRKLITTGLSPDWSENCRQYVDGKGAQRVASMITLGPETQLQCRMAKRDDESELVHWAGHPNSHIQEAKGRSDLKPWFRSKLRNPENCVLYVFETPDQLPILLFCFERHEKQWEISQLIAPYILDDSLVLRGLEAALCKLRPSTMEPIQLKLEKNIPLKDLILNGYPNGAAQPASPVLTISICSDSSSWINHSIPRLLLGWLAQGHKVSWSHDAENLPGGDLCFYLSYGKIVGSEIRARYDHNLVVHASDLPKGRGWSPTSWLILQGENQIPVTLLEAEEKVDSGNIYLQEWIELDGTELVEDWRNQLAQTSILLAQRFVDNYPAVLESGREQVGEPTYYQRRRPADSQLDPTQTLLEQMNLLRIVDNSSYPAFFNHQENRYYLRIDRSRKQE